EVTRAEKEKLPPQLARVVLEKKELPPPPKPVEPKKEEKKPEEKKPEEKKPEPKKEEKPKEVKPPPPQKDIEKAREKAQNSGVMQFKDDLAEMREMLQTSAVETAATTVTNSTG